MPKQRGKLSKERTLQKLVKEVGILHQLQVRRLCLCVVLGVCGWGGGAAPLSGASPSRRCRWVAFFAAAPEAGVPKRIS
jgi:hypothetical protein